MDLRDHSAGYSILLALGHGFELSEQNIIAVTDRTLFGEAHLYREWLPNGGRIFLIRKAC
ncbi:hypothetical protein NXY00_14225 [Bacteroides sp. BFG-551]|nr:hypothetical protein [Bacteroides sp. BFG-551]